MSEPHKASPARNAAQSGKPVAIGQASKLAAGVLIDRDGTLNHDRGYLWRWEEFQWIQGAPEALASLKKAGFKLAAVTNQSGVARGVYKESDVIALHSKINEDLLKRFGIEIDAWYFCPHHPQHGCQCRKPSPGMLLEAAKDLGLDLSRSYMIGDKVLDYMAGVNAGVRLSVLVRTGYGRDDEGNLPKGALVVDDIGAAAALIINDLKSQGDR